LHLKKAFSDGEVAVIFAAHLLFKRFCRCVSGEFGPLSVGPFHRWVGAIHRPFADDSFSRTFFVVGYILNQSSSSLNTDAYAER
jgi:hypothetical protein